MRRTSAPCMLYYSFLSAAAGLGLLFALGGLKAAEAAQARGFTNGAALPLVINTWAFTSATQQAWDAINDPKSATPALDAVEQGCSKCEDLQCDFTVGFGGSPDENSETTLDAMIMDGNSMETGAVSSLRHVRHAVSTARLVMERTTHTMLAGLLATQFAQDMGIPIQNLATDESLAMHKKWLAADCQPNFRRNVLPNPTKSCGPYHLPERGDPSHAQQEQQQGGLERGSNAMPGNGSARVERSSERTRGSEGGGGSSTAAASERGPTAIPRLQLSSSSGSDWPSERSHDTIAMVAIDKDGSIAAGCSTNGAIYKVPGRVGDGSVPGGGAYADSEVGGCGATGDGDVHLRFLPCYQVVESMRQGMKPKAAAEDAILRIARRVPGYVGAVFAVDKDGNHAAACHGWQFKYAYQNAKSDGVQVVTVEPITPVKPAPAD